MKVVLEILILKCLLCMALASPKDRIQKFSDISSEGKIGDYKNIFKKTQNGEDFEFYQDTIKEHSLKANDRRRDYVRYFRSPSKTDEDDSSDSSSSYDSSAEVSVERELKSDSNNLEKNKDIQTEGENSNSSSGEENEPHSRDTNVHEEDEEENSIIKSLLKKFNTSFHDKKTQSVKDTREVDIEQIFRESKIMKWREMEMAVKLLLIDNYKYTKKVLHKDIFNTTQSNKHQIFELKQKFLQEYYLLKKDISQMAKLAKKKCKKVVKKLGKRKTYEVEQLYFSQLKDQINQKVVVFKQKIKSAIDQWQLESNAKYSKTTDIQNVSSFKQPIDHEIDLTPVVSIIYAVNITADDMLEILWTENDENDNDLDGAVVLKQGFNKKSNKKTTFGIQSSTDTQTSSNLGQQNENTNGIIKKENKLTDTPTDAKNLSIKISDLSSTDVTSKLANSTMSRDLFLEPLRKNSENQLHEGTTVRNEQSLRYFSQEISSRLVASDIVKNNGKDNQVDNDFDIDIEFAQQKPSSTVNNELGKSESQSSASIYFYVTQHPHVTVDIGSQKSKAPSHITDSKFEDGIVSLNTNAVEISVHHNGLINHQIVTDYVNIRHENFTNLNKTKTVVESEINIHPPLNLTRTVVSDKKLESSDLLNDVNNVDNKITSTKNITTSEHVTLNTDSGTINEPNQIAETLMTNNKSISEALGHSNMKNNSPSIDHQIKIVKSIVKNDEINSTLDINFTTTPQVTDFIYSTESLASYNEVGYRENETKYHIISQRNETIELTNIDTRSQHVNDLNLTGIKTNVNAVKGSIDNSYYEKSSHISGNNGISNNNVVNYTENDYQIEQSTYVTPTNVTEIKMKSPEPRQLSNNNEIIVSHLQGTGNVTEGNNTPIHSLIPMENKYTYNSDVNGGYDYSKLKSTDDVTSDNNAYNNNKSIMDTDSQRRFRNATENLIHNNSRERQSVEPVDGNTENLPEQINVDVIPHDVNAENFQNTNDTKEEVEIVSIKSNSIDTTNDYEKKSMDNNNNSLNENSFTTPFVQIPFQIQNIKDTNNKDNSGKERDVNVPTSDIFTTLLYLNSATPPNNINKTNITQHKTTNQSESETSAENHLDNAAAVAAINTHSTNESSDHLLSDYNTNSIKNPKIIFTDIPVTGTNLTENLNTKPSGSSIQNQHSDNNNSFNKPLESVAKKSTKKTKIDKVTIADNNDVIRAQSEKTIQIDLPDGVNHDNELPIPHNVTTSKRPENEIIFNDPTKIILNKTYKVDSSRYGNEKIAANSTKVSDSDFLSIDTANHLDTTTNEMFYTGLEMETVTKNESKIINTGIPTPQIESEPTESTVASKVTSEKIIINNITKETVVNTTIEPIHKINSYCKDDKGTIIDCESNIENTNVKNEKPTVNVWPGIPEECLPLFLASDGTILREIPSKVDISDVQTRNLCVSIAITIIQLNSLST